MLVSGATCSFLFFTVFPILSLILEAYGAPVCELVSASPSSSADSAAPSSTGNGTGTDIDSGLIAATWYAGWNSDDFPLSEVSWGKYSHVIYSFA